MTATSIYLDPSMRRHKGQSPENLPQVVPQPIWQPLFQSNLLEVVRMGLRHVRRGVSRGLLVAGLVGLSVTIVVTAPLSTPPPAAANVVGYSVTDLGTLSGDAESAGFGINAGGQVAGVSATTAVLGCDYFAHHCDYHAFLYSSGSMTGLGDLPGGSASYGINVNDVGQVVGFGETSSTLEQAFLATNGTMISLGALPGGSDSIAYGINDAGTVVGWADTSGGLWRAFQYGSTGMTDLGTLPGDGQAQAYGINNVGQVVGWSFPTDDTTGNLCLLRVGNCPLHAFLYDNGSMAALENLPGATTSLAYNINDAGQIVGDSGPHGFLDTGGVMTDISTLPGGTDSHAIDINNTGQVVGWAVASDGNPHATIYQNAALTDLNSLIPSGSGWSLDYAYGINDAGQIVGFGTHAGVVRAFLLTPQTPPQLTTAGLADIWVGLKNSDDVGVRFDLRAEVYVNSTLATSGELDSVAAGSSGFGNAKLDAIPMAPFPPIDFPTGSTLSLKIYVRTACTGSGHNSGTARLWFNDTTANSNLSASIGPNTTIYYLHNDSTLDPAPGTGPKTSIDIATGTKCSAFKPFGTWTITP